MKYLKYSALIFALSLALTADGCGDSAAAPNFTSAESSRNAQSTQGSASSAEA